MKETRETDRKEQQIKETDGYKRGGRERQTGETAVTYGRAKKNKNQIGYRQV